MIFQNCRKLNNDIYVYDQEWYEENVPIEFILYRAIFYFTELKNVEDINNVYKQLNIEKYIEIFENLESKIQEKIINKDIWEFHTNSVKDIGKIDLVLKNYEERLSVANTHIENLENNIKEYEKGIADLTQLIKDKDVELVNYANQLRSISSSLSWKVTKPIRILAWILNPKSGASFIDRIMPPGGKRRIEYDKN